MLLLTDRNEPAMTPGELQDRFEADLAQIRRILSWMRRIGIFFYAEGLEVTL